MEMEWKISDRLSRITTLEENWFLRGDVLITEEIYDKVVATGVQPEKDEMYLINEKENLVKLLDIEGDIIFFGKEQKFARLFSQFV